MKSKARAIPATQAHGSATNQRPLRPAISRKSNAARASRRTPKSSGLKPSSAILVATGVSPQSAEATRAKIVPVHDQWRRFSIAGADFDISITLLDERFPTA